MTDQKIQNNNPKSPVQKLFEKDMNRREFLAHVGAGAMAITGVSGLLKALLDYGGSHKHVSGGYGSSSYGGSSQNRQARLS